MKRFFIQSLIFFLIFELGKFGLEIETLASKKGAVLFGIILGSAVFGMIMERIPTKKE